MNFCINVNIRKKCWSILHRCDNWQPTVDTRHSTDNYYNAWASSFWWSMVSAFSTISKDPLIFAFALIARHGFDLAVRGGEWNGWGWLHWGGEAVVWSREIASEVRTRPRPISRPRASNLFTVTPTLDTAKLNPLPFLSSFSTKMRTRKVTRNVTRFSLLVTQKCNALLLLITFSKK